MMIHIPMEEEKKKRRPYLESLSLATILLSPLLIFFSTNPNLISQNPNPPNSHSAVHGGSLISKHHKMSSSTTAAVPPSITTAASDAADGPVLTLINKRIRNLRKKLNRITQLEGKAVIKNKEQEDLLKSKPSLLAAIDELEKIRQPLSAAVDEEIALAVKTNVSASDAVKPDSDVITPDADVTDTKLANNNDIGDKKDDGKREIEDLLRLVYFASMFDVKSSSEFNRIMLTRSHERNCCLTYDYVTDDDADVMLGEHDLDLISLMGSLVISRPVDSTFSHQNALQRCVDHAKLWLEKSDQPIDPNNNNVTYAGLREKLEKIIGSEYVKITPEIKVTAEAAGNYAFQVPAQVETSVIQIEQKEDNSTDFERDETYEGQSSPVEEHPKHEVDAESSIETPAQTEQIETQTSGTDYKDQYVPRRTYQNQRGGGGRNGGIGGGRRGFGNGRGGRSGGRGGPYQNGRNQFNDQPGNYYPRNHHGGRGRGGSRGNGGYAYNNHASGVEVAES